VSDSQAADPAGDQARAQLRERQLLLMLEADRRILNREGSLAETLRFVVSEARQILNAWDVGILFVYTDELRVEISSDQREIGRSVPIAESISGLVLSSRKPLLVNNLQSDPELRERYFPRAQMDPAAQPPRLSVLAAELTLDGQAIGVINVEATPDITFDQSHLDFVTAVARQISMAIAHAALFDEDAFSVVGRILAERFTRRVVNAVAMTKIRADIDTEMQDQLMILAADQVLNAVHRINDHVGSVRALARDLIGDLHSPSPPGTDDLTSRLRMIEQDAERALEIPNDMRRLIAAPQVSADVNAQVEAGLAAVRLPRNIVLDKDLAPGLPGIPCTALDLVIENLVKNAVAAMRDQPGILTVATRLDRRLPREPFIAVTVADSGTGMTEAERALLFEPRQSARRGSGLGFGMPWVRSWVRRAQGLIDVESALGRGTTVRLRFQIRSPAAGQVPAEEEPT
jgi:signal transduction histidine kinase